MGKDVVRAGVLWFYGDRYCVNFLRVGYRYAIELHLCIDILLKYIYQLGKSVARNRICIPLQNCIP